MTDAADCQTSRSIEHLRESFEREFKRIDQILMEREKHVELSMRSVSIATTKAEAEALRARDQQNEWRATITDLIGRFATVESLEAMKERHDQLERFAARMVGGMIALGIFAPLLSSLLVSLVVYYLTKQ